MWKTTFFKNIQSFRSLSSSIFIAGFTSSSLMSYLAYELVVSPKIQKTLQDEIDLVAHKEAIFYKDVFQIKYLDKVVSKALRKYSPGYVLNRICVKDDVIKPKFENEKIAVVEKDCLVAIPVIALHYCPEFFPNPAKFDPARFSDENKRKIQTGSDMPFGMGPRNCIGRF